MTHADYGYGIGTWCRHDRYAAPCRVVDAQEIWGESVYRVWLPGKDAAFRARYAYDARRRAIGRIGLQTVREYRRKRLRADHEAFMAQIDAAEAYVPDLDAVLMLRVGERKAEAS